MLTHFASLDFIAFAANLDQGTGSRVERCETSTRMVSMSFKARFVVGRSHGSFSFIVGRKFAEELAIDFAQRAGHVAHDVLVVLWWIKMMIVLQRVKCE